MTKIHADVLCSGIIVVDHVAAPIDAMPNAGQLVLTDDCLVTIGGCASNVAVDLCKMNVSTAVNGCVGEDLFGRFAKEFLEQAGADASHVVATDQAPTSQTLIINVKGQDRRFIHLAGANKIFRAAHLPREAVRQAKVFYVGGYLLTPALLPEDLAEAFKEARAHGVATVLDVVTPGPADYFPLLAPVLPHTDVFLPNNDESALITGFKDPLKQAEAFREAGAKTVVITCGGEGCVLITDGLRLRSGAYSVPFVDGTGGGDAFDAGYICGLLEGADPKRCLEIGSALGASCVQRSGATAGVFTRAQADAFLTQRTLAVETIP
jgi:sugar/nucleoside kinase (ribokinase family)